MPIFVAGNGFAIARPTVNEYRPATPRARPFYRPDPANVRQPERQQPPRAARFPHPPPPKGVLANGLTRCRSNMSNTKNHRETRVARELAAIALPVNLYTEWYWKSICIICFTFVALRMIAHAQKEIRDYARRRCSPWIPPDRSGGGGGVCWTTNQFPCNCRV